MEPLVSILIPAYNAEEWLADTLNSALAQTWRRRELIVVDDGSTDRTFEIAREFASPALKVIRQRNCGAAAARNLAFSECQGEYVQWLDSDDLLAPDKIEQQMRVLEGCSNPRTLASGPWGRFLYRQEHAKFVPTALWCDLSPAEWLLRKLEQNLHMQTATWLVSRELTRTAGPWNTSLLVDDDGEYFCRVLLASDGVKFVSGAKVYYRMAGFNRLSYIGNSKGKIKAQFESMKLHIGHLRSLEDSPRARAAGVRYLQNWQIHFYPEHLDLVEQCTELAGGLGGSLQPPRLSWKYSWINALFGWKCAKRVQLALPQIRWSLQRRMAKEFHRQRRPGLGRTSFSGRRHAAAPVK